MKIGILTGDHKQNETGIGNYILNLINELKNFPDELSVIRHPNGYDYDIKKQIIPHTFPSAGMMVWSCVISAQRHLFSDMDLVHSPTLALFPVKPHENYVFTAHDIIFKKFPDYLPIGTIRHTKLFFHHNLKLSDRIIADSESTKEDLITCYRIPKEKITTIPVAADKIYSKLPECDVQKIREKYSLFIPFVLYVGTIEPRKNIILILEAFSHLQKSIPDLELVIAGKKGWYYEEIFQKLNTLHIQNKVKFLGYVPLPDLPGLYNAATIFVYPSLYEGFGIPPLEAMQCGTPVITSNVSSLPEVMGEKGLMVPPDDPFALHRAMKKIIQDRSFREEQIKYGLERSRQFSWKRTAEMTRDVYEEVIRSKKCHP